MSRWNLAWLLGIPAIVAEASGGLPLAPRIRDDAVRGVANAMKEIIP